MSILNSNLAKYGYDTVVAVTQKALNNAIETYYKDATTFSPVTFYFIKDSSGNPVAVDKATLLANYTSGIDPLATNVSVTQQKTLSASAFYFAFTYQIGNPQNYLSTNYLTLKPETNSVRYYLLCFQLQVAFWNPDNKTWVDIKQTTAKEFNIYADINLKNVLDNTNLPSQVQAAVSTLGGTNLNIQQLIFDLDTAVVDPTSTLTQLDSNCSVFKSLMQQFANTYFSTYTSQSGALNYAITTQNNASLVPTAMDWYINAFVDGNGNPVANPTQDQQDLATLNYLFANNGDALPAGTQISWNWLDDNGTSQNPDLDTNADVNKYDGAIAINRDAFAKYLDTQLTDYVKQNTFTPSVVPMYIDDGKADSFSIELCPATSIPAGFQPFNPQPYTADYLVHWSSDQTATAQGKVNPANTMKIESYFDLNLGFYRGIAILEQTFEFNAYETYNQVEYGGPIMFIYSRDYFNLVIDDQGNLMFQKNTQSSVFTKQQHDYTFMGEGDNSRITDWIAAVTAKSFEELPVSFPQQFVFPGGNAFTFQDAGFASNSDIVCHFTYKAES